MAEITLTSWFANPWALWLLTMVPVLGMFSLWGWYWRRRALAQLGNIPALRALLLVRRGPRLLRGLCFLAGVSVLIVGMAGPQWGRDLSPEAAVAGRDLVVVLDLSRSMLAEQPSRQERARRALRDLADTLQLHGGHRVALVVFAGRAQLAFPLTNDYDHFRQALDQLDADSLPPELRPSAEDGAVSGTRIGAGLTLAVATHDARFEGAQDIVLISDGDDPAQDSEWAQGAEAAKKLKIPVYTVGVGDPDRASPIPFGAGFLRHQDKLVTTRLHEQPLQEIARRTGGIYLPGQTRALPLGKLFREVIEPAGQRLASEVESTAALPIPRQHYPWFLGIALGLLTVGMLVGDRNGGRRGRRGLWLMPLALILISADPADDLVRRGNTAFAGEDYAAALKFYEQAEERAVDPGRVAFNKAAALYRLERYREAELHYQRCLEDQEAPPLRKARAHYDLGNSLVKQAQATDAAILKRALSNYRQCLSLNPEDEDLLDRARHNFELAMLLWLKARAAQRDGPNETEQPEDHKPTPEPNTQQGARAQKGKLSQQGEPGAAEKNGDDSEPGNGQKKLAAQGKLLNLPDRDELVPLPPEDAVALLTQTAERILRERRDYRRQAVPASEKVMDW